MILFILLLVLIQTSSSGEPANKAESPHELILSAHQLSTKPKWDPLSGTACPISVEEAVTLSRRALKSQFPSENDKGLFVTCKLSSVDSPEIRQDIDDTIFVPLLPHLWTVTFVKLDPFGGKAKLNLTYAVYLDGKVESPILKTMPNSR